MTATTHATRVAHLITDLNGFGGTENTLLRYLQNTEIPLSSQMVVVLRSAGEGDTIGAQIRRTGVALHEFHLGKGQVHPSTLLRLWRLLKEFQPTCISAWLYHPILLAWATGAFLPACRQVWHIRSLPFTPVGTHERRQRVVKLVGWLTRRSKNTLVTNSQAAQDAHCAIGYRPHNWIIVPNGVDFDRLEQATERRQAVRAALGLTDCDLLLSTIGRFCPEKGHIVLASALELLRKRLPKQSFDRIHWMGVGNLVEHGNEVLETALRRALPAARLHLLGKRADVPELLAASDLFVLPSISESFPNALIEAMGAGIYPIASEVGGVKELGLPAHCLAAPGDAASLAGRVEQALETPSAARRVFTSEWRSVVRERYAIHNMARRFDQTFTQSELR